MKKVIFVLIFIFCIASLAFAHPPTNIEIKVSASQLDITVTHPVSSPATHFIKYIEVKVNAEKMIAQNFKTQSDNNTQQARYLIPSLKKGDKLSIEAECNQYGELKKDFQVQ